MGQVKKQVIPLLNSEKKLDNFDIFSAYDDEVHPGRIFVHLYGELYDTYSVFGNINVELFIKNLEKKHQINSTNFIIKDEYSKRKKVDEIDYGTCSYLLRLKDKLLVYISNYKVVFYYSSSIDFAEIKDIIALIKQSKKEKKHKRKFYMVAANSHSEFGIELRKFNIKKQEISLNENYNDDFIEVDKTIRDFLGTDKLNGVVLLHGKYGTGKTSYIRNLMGTINKRFIFLPVNMMESISSPNFLPFISKYNNSILILEDCETIIKQRESGNSDNSLVNLLNLGDGLLSDALSIKLICTFNADLKQIDRAILRKGRLITRYEFQELSVEKSKKLCEKIGATVQIDQPKTLAEIYNYDSKNTDNKQVGKKIGFK
jgi:hypothetical protein